MRLEKVTVKKRLRNTSIDHKAQGNMKRIKEFTVLTESDKSPRKSLCASYLLKLSLQNNILLDVKWSEWKTNWIINKFEDSLMENRSECTQVEIKC